ncbi:hypothetical protein [Streptomyces sp. NPDC085540]
MTLLHFLNPNIRHREKAPVPDCNDEGMWEAMAALANYDADSRDDA